jgi:hypothetical protein
MYDSDRTIARRSTIFFSDQKPLRISGLDRSRSTILFDSPNEQHVRHPGSMTRILGLARNAEDD